jgi:hypothetical protein
VKPYVLYFLIFFFSLSAYSQIDSKKKSFSIPAVETKEDPEKEKPILPVKPEMPSNLDPNLNIPKNKVNLELPKKEFSMFAEERFGNPGELYQKQLNDAIADVKLSKKELELRNGSTTDQYFGDFKSNAKFVNVVYRDHGYVDGDIIQVRVNDDIVHARVFLSGGFKGFQLDLKPGFNKIDFLALNQGESGPNTAEFRVADDTGAVITQNRWNLATGVKATIIVIKE